MSRILRSSACLLLLAAGAAAAAPPVNESGTPPAVEQLIVRMGTTPPPGLSRADQVARLGARNGVGLRWQREMSGGASVARLAAPLPPPAARALAERLARDADVDYASPDYRRRPLLVPDDAGFNEQWGVMAPDGRVRGLATTGGAALTAAWDISTGSAASVVAVLDTGTLPHPDLAGRLLPGYDFITNSFVANDGGGRDSDAADPGDWVTAADAAQPVCSGDEPRDSSWHGTAVAGVIAALGNNAADLAGADWSARVLPVRVLGKCGGFDSDIIDALRWAVGLTVRGAPLNPYPAGVLNLSLGAVSECTSAYRAAFGDVRTTGAVVVVAAGNNNDVRLAAPANCPDVIAVTAHAVDGSNSSYANVGPGTVLSAPGGGQSRDNVGVALPVRTLSNAGSTVPSPRPALSSMQGTSFAAPLVAGTAALLRPLLPGAPPDTIRDLLAGSARPHPPGSWCTQEGQPQAGLCGSGLLDAGRALAAATALGRGKANLPPMVDAPAELSGRAGTALGLTLAARDPDQDAVAFTALALPEGATLDARGRFDWPAPVAGESLLRFTASDGHFTVGPQEIRLRIAPPPAAGAGGGGGGGALAPLALPLLVLLALWRTRRRPP